MRQTTKKCADGADHENSRGETSHRLFRKHVADASNGFDQPWKARIISQLLAQVRDMNVHRALANHNVIAAGLGEQRIPRYYPPSAPDQRDQDVEFNAGQLHRLVLPSNFSGGDVDGDAPDCQPFGNDIWMGTAQDRAKAGEQLTGAKRLGDVIVR